MKGDRDLLVLASFCWIVALILFVCCISLAQDIPTEPQQLDEKNNWVYGTVGTDELDTLDEAKQGDIVCQQWTDKGFQLLAGGILMSEQKAHYFGQISISYKEIRQLYEIDLNVHKAVLNIYENELKEAQKQVNVLAKKSKRGWWEKNDFVIGMVLGIVLSVGATVGIAAGLYSIGR